jgi:hypothetical protein
VDDLALPALSSLDLAGIVPPSDVGGTVLLRRRSPGWGCSRVRFSWGAQPTTRRSRG